MYIYELKLNGQSIIYSTRKYEVMESWENDFNKDPNCELIRHSYGIEHRRNPTTQVHEFRRVYHTSQVVIKTYANQRVTPVISMYGQWK